MLIHSIVAYLCAFNSSSFNSAASFPFHDALLEVDASIADVMDKMLLEDVMLHEHRALRLELPFDRIVAAHPTLSHDITIY
jgi:hypothetical protein